MLAIKEVIDEGDESYKVIFVDDSYVRVDSVFVGYHWIWDDREVYELQLKEYALKSAYWFSMILYEAEELNTEYITEEDINLWILPRVFYSSLLWDKMVKWWQENKKEDGN